MGMVYAVEMVCGPAAKGADHHCIEILCYLDMILACLQPPRKESQLPVWVAVDALTGGVGNLGWGITSSISFRIPSKALRALAPSSREKPPLRTAFRASSCNCIPYDSSASARACAKDNNSSLSTQP
jgi:hypothetical protein